MLAVIFLVLLQVRNNVEIDRMLLDILWYLLLSLFLKGSKLPTNCEPTNKSDSFLKNRGMVFQGNVVYSL